MSAVVWFSIILPFIQAWVMLISEWITTIKTRGVYKHSPSFFSSTVVFVVIVLMAYFTFFDWGEHLPIGQLLLFLVGATVFSYGIPLLINRSYLITNGTENEVINVLDKKIAQYDLPFDQRENEVRL